MKVTEAIRALDTTEGYKLSSQLGMGWGYLKQKAGKVDTFTVAQMVTIISFFDGELKLEDFLQ